MGRLQRHNRCLFAWLWIGVILFFPAVVYFFFSHSLYFLLASFSPDKKSATLVKLAQQLQWYFLQWNSVTVCLQPHVKHEWNNRYSRFFLYFTLCVCRFFSFCLRRLCILFDFPLIFYFCLHWCHLHFGERFIQHLLLVSIIIWSETRPFFVELCFCWKRERMEEKNPSLQAANIYIENIRNNPQQSIVKTVWKWKCAKCHRSWLWGVPFIRNFVLQTTSLLSLLPSSSRMVVLVLFF